MTRREGKGGRVRILLVVALLGITASCVFPPPPEASAAPPQPVALAPAPPTAPMAAAAAPAPPPPAVPAVYVSNPLAWLFPAFSSPPPPGRLTLSNFTFDSARVQALVTPYPDCQAQPGTAASDFELPLNGTRIIAPPPGADVCWRRALPADHPHPAATATPGWTDWSRVFTSSGRSIDSRL